MEVRIVELEFRHSSDWQTNREGSHKSVFKLLASSSPFWLRQRLGSLKKCLGSILFCPRGLCQQTLSSWTRTHVPGAVGLSAPLSLFKLTSSKLQGKGISHWSLLKTLTTPKLPGRPDFSYFFPSFAVQGRYLPLSLSVCVLCVRTHVCPSSPLISDFDFHLLALPDVSEWDFPFATCCTWDFLKLPYNSLTGSENKATTALQMVPGLLLRSFCLRGQLMLP